MNKFGYVSVLLDMMYGIEMEEEQLEELGLVAWNLIGNRNTKLYRCRLPINPIDNSIELPCNALDLNDGRSCVELVTTNWEDWESTTNYSINGDQRTSYIENTIEAEKRYQSPYYLPGKVLKYEQVGYKLYFTHNYGVVNILYKGVISDEDGLPELSDKEALAIATYLAYITKFKEGLVTNNPNIIQLANTLKVQWLQQCDQARVTYMNQNDFNSIMDIAHSWDRKPYGKGFKIIR